MDVESCSGSDRRHIAPEVGPAGSGVIGLNRLWREALAEGQPVGAGANAVQCRIDRALQAVTGIRQEVPHPHAEGDDVLGRIFFLAKLDMSKAIAPQDRLQIKWGFGCARGQGLPGCRGTGATGSRRRGWRRHTAVPVTAGRREETHAEGYSYHEANARHTDLPSIPADVQNPNGLPRRGEHTQRT